MYNLTLFFDHSRVGGNPVDPRAKPEDDRNETINNDPTTAQKPIKKILPIPAYQKNRSWSIVFQS